MYVINSKWVVGTCVHEGLSECVLEEGEEGGLVTSWVTQTLHFIKQ